MRRAEGFEGFSQFSQHALGTRTLPQPLGQGFGVRCRPQGRHLRQPTWRLFTQHLRQQAAIGAAAQLSQGFEDGQIRFTGAILLNALTPRDPSRERRRRLGHEAIDQRRLAHTGFARNKHRLALALQSADQALMQVI